MDFVLQFAAILSICWLIQGVVTHANHHEDKSLNNKNGPTVGDFYFDEQKAGDNVKAGRIITQSAWSKEEEEALPEEDKISVLFNDEFSFKNALTYLVNMIHELKEDIFGIKEMASLKKKEDLSNFQDKSENKVEHKKMEENKDALRSGTKIPNLMSTRNTEIENKNRHPKSNYIVDYYKNNGMKFVDEDLEASGDESDDSSHKLDEGDTEHEIIENKDDPCISKCLKIEGNSDRHSSETTNNPMSKTEIIDETDKDFDEDGFEESITRSSKMKQNKAKTSEEEAESIETISSKLGECVEHNNNYDSNKLNRENETTENILESTEYATRDSQNENFKEGIFKTSNSNKTTDNLSKPTSPSSNYSMSEKNSKNKSGSDLDDESVVLGSSTTLSFQSSKEDIDPENVENEPISTEKPASKMQEEQISLYPEDEKQTQNNAKSFQNNHAANEHTISSQPHESRNETPNQEITTDTQVEDRPKESKSNRLNVDSSQSSITNNQKESGSKREEQQTYIYTDDTDNPVLPTSSENLTKSYNLNKHSSDNLNAKEEENANVNDAETQNYNKTGQTKTQQLSNDKLKDNNQENSNKKDDNMASMTTNDLPSPPLSNHEIQSEDIEGSGKSEEQKNKETLNKRDGTFLDNQYKNQEELDVSNKLAETVGDLDQNQKSELATNDKNEEANVDNTATVLTNESQISQRTEYAMEEKSPEQYNTFLEYFYKNSNSPFFKSLKNQSLFL